MARQTTCVVALVVLLAARQGGAQALDKMLDSSAMLSGAGKAGSSHLERMLLNNQPPEPMEEPREPTGLPTLESCSPSALLKPDTDCRLHATAVADPKAEPADGAVLTKPSVECAGPNCADATAVPAGTAATDAATAPTPRDPISAPPRDPRTFSFGPMTQNAFERLVNRKRAAAREKLRQATQAGYTTLMRGRDPLARDIPAPEPVPRHATDAAGIPLPAASPPGLDFSRVGETPAPQPQRAAGRDSTSRRVSETPAPRFDFDLDAAAAGADEIMGRMRTPATADHVWGSADPRHAQHAQHASGPRMMTAEEARRNAEQRHAAFEAAKQRKRANVRGQASAGASAGSCKPSGSATEKAQCTQQQQQQQHSGPTRPPAEEGPRAGAAARGSSGAASAQRAKPAQQQQQQQQQQSQAQAQQRRQTQQAGSTKFAQPPRVDVVRTWEPIDLLCAAALLIVSPLAMFMAAAILEDLVWRPQPEQQQAKQHPDCRRPVREEGTPLVLHWFALTHSLWRRCRRAAMNARKQLTGHASDLPTTVNEGGSPIPRAVAAVAAFAHAMVPRSHAHAVHSTSGSGGGSSARALLVPAADDATSANATGVAMSLSQAAPRRQQAAAASSPFALMQQQQDQQRPVDETLVVEPADGDAGMLRRRF